MALVLGSSCQLGLHSGALVRASSTGNGLANRGSPTAFSSLQESRGVTGPCGRLGRSRHKRTGPEACISQPACDPNRVCHRNAGLCPSVTSSPLPGSTESRSSSTASVQWKQFSSTGGRALLQGVGRTGYPRAVRRWRVRAAEKGGSSDTGRGADVQLYGKIERVFSESAKWSHSGPQKDWQEVEGAWVLRPSAGEPARAVVHFIGGAFVGASPQLTYRLFLQELADRGVLVIATPYACGFDHFRIADEAQFRMDRCLRVLTSADTEEAAQIRDLPVFGVGHSLGALTHLLIGSRYAVQRSGNVLLSFNNKEVSQTIPLFSPVLLPMTQNVGPLLAQILQNPTLRLGADLALKQLKALNSPIIEQILPLFEQLPPLYNDLASGKDEFIPTPDETRNLVRSYYGIRRNLLIRFRDDSIDETPILADTLSVNSAVSENLDLSIRTLPGDHARPLQQAVPDIQETVGRAVQEGSQLFSAVPGISPFADMAKDFLSSSMAQGVGPTMGLGLDSAQRLREQALEDIRALVDEVAPFVGGSIREERKSQPLLLPGQT